MRLLCVLLLVAATFAGPQQRTGTATVLGRVIASDTGGPARFARVYMQAASPDGFTWTISTDEEGRFVIPNVPAARYTIQVSKTGYIDWVFGRDPVGARSRPEPFEVRDGQKVDRGDLRLPKGGVISGRVFDRYGDPAMGVDVRALRYVNNVPGQRRLGPVAEGLTNDLGEYRIYGLQPGRYYVGTGFAVVRASAQQTSTVLQVIPAQRGYMLNFYPGTPVASNASPIDVRAGGEVQGIDLRLETTALTSVSGTVLNALGQPASGVTVMLNPSRTDNVMLVFPALIEPVGGRFTFVNIPPGDYRVDVIPRAAIDAVGRTGTLPPPGSYEWASVPIAVSSDKVESLVVQMTPGYEVAGRVVAESGSLPPEALAGLQIRVTPRFQLLEGVSAYSFDGLTNVQSDGRFSVRGAGGSLGIRLYRYNNWFLKAIRLNGEDVTDEGIDVRTDVRTLEVVITSTPTRIRGSVVDAGGTPVRDYGGAVVFSQDEKKWTLPMTRYVTSAEPDKDGRFTVNALPPGNYWVAVVSTLESDWPTPDSLSFLRATAISVTIADSETKTVTVVVK